jgi:hypothetical protein
VAEGEEHRPLDAEERKNIEADLEDLRGMEAVFEPHSYGVRPGRGKRTPPPMFSPTSVVLPFAEIRAMLSPPPAYGSTDGDPGRWKW